MSRSFHLGPEGERASRRLADVHELASGFFNPCLLTSPYPEALDELRRRLAEKAQHLEHWAPDGTLLERAARLARSLADDDPRPLLWLQQKTFEPEPWREALRSLNWNRESYQRTAP